MGAAGVTEPGHPRPEEAAPIQLAGDLDNVNKGACTFLAPRKVLLIARQSVADRLQG